MPHTAAERKEILMKALKTFAALISAAAIAVSAVPSATADDGTAKEMQSVLTSVKERIEIPTECSQFTSSVSEENSEKLYNFTWRSEDWGKYVNITCHADGTITSLSLPTDITGLSSPHIPSVNESTARANAEKFLRKANPNFKYDLDVEDGYADLFGSGYTFELMTYVNGVEYRDGSGSINVDSETGEVTRFYFNYTTLDFPSLNSALSQEAAQAAFCEKLGLELKYAIYKEGDKDPVAFPVYTMRYPYGTYINALTGDTVTLYSVAEMNALDSDGAGSAAGNSAELTPEEQAELAEIEKLLPSSEIEKHLKSNPFLAIPSDMKTESVRLFRRYYDDKYMLSITMQNDSYDSIYVTIDPDTGDILYYYRSTDGNAEEKSGRNDEALKSLIGDKAKEYKFDENNGEYLRYANGIEVDGDAAHITFTDGAVTHFRASYTEVDFPSLDSIKDTAEAEKILFDNRDYSLVYAISGDRKSIVPIYTIDYVRINALTGKFVNFDNTEISDEVAEKITYSDLDGHWAKSQIEALALYGIGFAGREFKPNTIITQRDFLALLMSIKGNAVYINDADLAQTEWVYSYSKGSGVIADEDFDADAPLTRETAAIYMIRSIGAEEYAKYNDIYVTPFDDVTDNKGYVALLYAMGVIRGNGSNKFEPHREITRAEAAMMIYNYLMR